MSAFMGSNQLFLGSSQLLRVKPAVTGSSQLLRVKPSYRVKPALTGLRVQQQQQKASAPKLLCLVLPQDVLLPSEVKILLQQEQHKPNFVLSVLTQIVHSMPATEGQKLALDTTLSKFQKAVGTCERMVKTPIPRSYTR